MEKNFLNLKGQRADAFPDVPDDYFSKLPERLVKEVGKPRTRKLQQWHYALAVAASLLVFIGLTFLLLNKGIQHPESQIVETHNNTLDVNQNISNNIPDSEGSDSESGQTIRQGDKHFSPDDNYVKLIAGLDDLPFDVVLDYLNEIDELGF